MIRTKLCDTLGIKYPIIQAGMGPFNTTNLAAAVSNAGGLGTISIPYSTGPEIGAKTVIEHLHKVQRNTDRNFAVNTPIGSEKTSTKLVLDTFDAIVEAVVKEKEKDPDLNRRLLLYITSGGNPERHHKRIKEAGFIHFHLVASARHAKAAEQLGLDGVIASGYEMGGHTHLADRAIHSLVLIPAVAQAVKIPVVASGGICDAATFAAALALGAMGVQIGTRFIATKECDFHDNVKKAILDADEYSDIVVPSFISPARCLKTPGAYKILEAQEMVNKGEFSYEEKTKMVDDALRLAEEEGNIENGLVGAGQNSSRINEVKSVQEVMDSMVGGAEHIIRELQENLA